jgi:UDP-GlcNAc3NAcA epimerase
MQKIVTIVGARPQFIKASVVSRTLQLLAVPEVIIHTGQHFDSNMSDIFFEEMQIPKPHYNLEINSLHHGAMTGRMLEKIENVLLDEKPDLVLVYGDTNSTLAGALAAKKIHIKVAHIEAGLRSFNQKMPEEINRILTDRISDLLFCPTSVAVNNLKKEGFETFDSRIIQVGDVMYDAALFYEKLSEKRSTIIADLNSNNEKYILCTIHRQENTDDENSLKSIMDALNAINRKIKIIMPLHPRTKQIIKRVGIKINFKSIDPVGYFDMIQLIKNSSLVMTDSGGLQKEAYFYRKYCLTIRDQTEWIELVENGYNFLAHADTNQILNTFEKIQTLKKADFSKHLYGDGNAALKIVKNLKKYCT